MAFGQFHGLGGRSGKPMTSMSDINVTPMVDVMLVLLVIFIIAAPLLNHAIRLDLPDAASNAVPQEIKTVTISFDAEGALYWDTDTIDMEELSTRMAWSAKQKTQPEILLRADKSTRFELIAQVMAAAQEQGLSKIGFATQSLAKTDAADKSKKLLSSIKDSVAKPGNNLPLKP
jgi:biopolymer transport protein ExbD